MRILSQSEFQRLDAETQLPVDLAQQYFPVQLRAFSMMNGEVLAYHDRSSGNKAKDLQKYMESASYMVDSKRVLVVDKVSQDGYVYKKDVVSELDWESFEFGVGTKENRSVTLLKMFPVRRLALSKMLAEQGVEQRPGYIYFVAKVNKSGISESDYKGSDIYGHSNYLYWKEFEQKRTLYNESDKKIPEWKGEIDDLAHCTNSRIVKEVELEDSRHYILETPLEFPRGFVRETAMVLKKEWSAASKLVKDFCELCFEKPNSLPELKKDEENVFPQGEPKLTGPDLWWRYSSDPWLVQTILLARLIGGDFWQYALSNLEESSPNLNSLDLLDS